MKLAYWFSRIVGIYYMFGLIFAIFVFGGTEIRIKGTVVVLSACVPLCFPELIDRCRLTSSRFDVVPVLF
jgi:hypothetical protein